MAVGGDIIEITYNHPTVGSGVLYPKAAEDNTFDTGGFRSADDANMIDGAGNMIDQMNRVRWMFEGSVSWDMNNAEELERLVQLASSPIQADFTFTHINGTIYAGKGKPVGDYKGNGNTAQIPVKISGGGTLKQI